MSVEEVTEAPNWLVKLEEQREKRLKVKLGHEAGAGAPCQNCGDKCPGLDLHFWRKICKLCKCGKEDHDISDDDIYGFVQFQLLGSKPTKAKIILLAGKEDAITLDWTPKGSNTDVKKYLEGLPEELLPVKGSEAARIRKQRLQKQLPAHDIDASLCHALTPEEIQQLEEYVAHIRNHSVGQGQIIQIPIIRGEQHKFAPANTQYINQQTPGKLSSSQPVTLQPTNLAQNLQNLSLRDKPINNRTAFLNSQIPKAANANIEEQNPEFVNYSDKTQPNYAAKSLHQIVDTQNPTLIGKVNDINYPVLKNVPHPEHLVSDTIIAQHPVTGEIYYIQNPEYSQLVNNPIPYNKNTEFSNLQEPISSEQYSRQNPNFANKYVQNHPYDDNVYKVPHPNVNVVHSTQNMHLPQHNAQILANKPQDKTENVAQIENIPYLNQNTDILDQKLGAQSWVPANFERVQFLENNAPYSEEILPNRSQNDPYKSKNLPYNEEQVPNTQKLGYAEDILTKNEPYNAKNLPYNLDKVPNVRGTTLGSEFIPNLDKNHPENLIQLPLTTSNVEKHQEQFLNNDYSHINDTKYKNRVPIPVYNAESKVNPYEYEQNMSSVGFIRDIDYNIPKIQDSDVINSNAIPTCHKCKKSFNDGVFAIAVNRTESLWHSECFNCHTCSQPLADLLYFYHKETDNIYCGRDYALLKGIPRCAACDELIFVREYCLAEERTFHIKHFCCFECDEPLAGKQYVMENNQPNCVDCYEKLKAEKCTDCGYVIGPEEQGVNLQGLHWHATEKCFACKYCRKALLAGKMLLRKQNLFCSDVCFKTYHA